MKRSADAVTREVITGKLLATVDEMAIVLARASMSPVIYEVLDFACGVCDAQGDLIAQTNGITVFTGTFSRQVHFIVERFGPDMAPGDTFLTNDPFEGGTHAWVEVLIPVDEGSAAEAHALDPTHGGPVGSRHITVAVGRDYGDVAPTSGSYRASCAGALTARRRVALMDVEYAV